MWRCYHCGDVVEEPATLAYVAEGRAQVFHWNCYWREYPEGAGPVIDATVRTIFDITAIY